MQHKVKAELERMVALGVLTPVSEPTNWASSMVATQIKTQISLDHKSSLLTAFSTPFGRFRFLQMPFGINSACKVFQYAMEQIFAGYLCAVIMDVIIVGGNGEEKMMQI
ncbi:hypothetical protein QQF64_009503 [Cirrhinus molitorella]|uniref:Reverse transcriptase n=1 Tax=Cirrhinus molitorella TaxID=172907 RepID=A0ABR3M3V1_9TELE